MRGRDAIAVALRHPDGEIVFATERLDSGFHGTRWSKWPLIRGLVVLYETLVVGTRWLVRSANVQVEDEGVELGKGSVDAAARGHAGRRRSAFFFLAAAVHRLGHDGQRRERPRPAPRRGVDPRRALPRLPRADQSGAGYPPRLPVPRRRAHDDPRARGGRSADGRRGPQVPDRPPALRDRVPRRGHPPVDHRVRARRAADAAGHDRSAGSCSSRSSPRSATRSSGSGRATARTRVVKVLLYPGLLVQMITTKQPTDDMIEVAIVSMEQALEADGESVPDGFRRLRAAADASARRHPRARTDRPATRVVSDLDAKLAEIAGQYDDLQAELARPETSTDPAAIRRLGQELARLEPVVEAYRRLEATRAELAGARELRDSSDADDELKSMARDEIDSARGRRDDPHRGPQGPAPAPRPERRPQRHPGDPRRRRRRGGRAVRRRALPDVHPLQRAPPLQARDPQPQRDGDRRDQGGDPPDPRRRRLQPPQVRGWRPPRPARPGDRVVRVGSTPRR